MPLHPIPPGSFLNTETGEIITLVDLHERNPDLEIQERLAAAAHQRAIDSVRRSRRIWSAVFTWSVLFGGFSSAVIVQVLDHGGTAQRLAYHSGIVLLHSLLALLSWVKIREACRALERR